MKRLPLETEKNEKKIAEKNVEAIAETLNAYYTEETKWGWMNGLSGISCFFFHFYHLTGREKYKQLAFEALQKSFNAINEGYSNPSFASGLSGIMWLVNYLASKGFISREEAANLKQLNPYLLKSAGNYLNEGNFDFLYGGTGLVMSLSSDNTSGYPTKFSRLLFEALNKFKTIHPDQTVSWQIRDSSTGKTETNLGLAHGLPSILLVLSKLLPYLGSEKVMEILNPGMAFLLKHLDNSPDSESIFPYSISEGMEQRPSRLAWCYGDPGVGMAIHQIGENCNNDLWITTGLNTIIKSAERRSLVNNRVYDACLCHGSAGLAAIYFSLAQKTGRSILHETADYWHRETNRFGYQNGKYGNYSFRGINSSSEKRHSLLEGITGVGLSLISYIQDDLPGWESGLLI